jgi:two-component system response regulator FlrC
MKKTVPQLNWEAQKKLLSHPWPGNVRELDNTVQRALILQQGNEITAEDLVLTPVPKNRRFDVEAVSENIHIDLSSDNALGSDLKQREIELIVQALNEEPSRKDAAERLGISPRTLRYKVAKLREEGIDIEAQLA